MTPGAHNDSRNNDNHDYKNQARLRRVSTSPRSSSTPRHSPHEIDAASRAHHTQGTEGIGGVDGASAAGNMPPQAFSSLCAGTHSERAHLQQYEAAPQGLNRLPSVCLDDGDLDALDELDALDAFDDEDEHDEDSVPFRSHFDGSNTDNSCLDGVQTGRSRKRTYPLEDASSDHRPTLKIYKGTL